MKISQKKNGPGKHRLVALVQDRSKSTYYLRKDMNEVFRHAMEKMKGQTEYAQITELLVVQFDTEPEVMAQFTPLAEVNTSVLEIRESDGCTNTGKALLLTLELLKQKKQEYRDAGEECIQPLLFLISDGPPDPGEGAPTETVTEYARLFAEAGAEIHRMEKIEKLVFAAASMWNKTTETAYGRRAAALKKERLRKLRELTSHSDYVVGFDVDKDDLQGIEKFFEIILQSTGTFRPFGTPPPDMLKAVFGEDDY